MRKSTKYLAAVAAIAIGAVTPPMVAAQTTQKSLARLADIMSAVQFRHSKLWTAGQQQSWELAAYELELVKSSLTEAIALYTDIPVDNITMIDPPIRSLENAIAARDKAAFGKAFNALTTGCNSCHQSIGRGFIVMTVPTTSPFGNQSFAPHRGTEEKKNLRR
jgi:hypothetical protein